MRKIKLKLFFILAVILAIGYVVMVWLQKQQPSQEVIEEITATVGSIKTFISCTGTVLPKNRLEVKPPVNGRMEEILVREGDTVKAGQILAWMSSTERAALLDAARGRGEKELKYWEETYKPIPLRAPIDAEIIVSKIQPGQAVTTGDAVVVLSDQLIVRAVVDETDIGKIKPDNKAVITLDAYPEIKIKASVEHIYYESKTVNNVTAYEVDLRLEETPAFFRSGMNAGIDFVEHDKENVLLIPEEAIYREAGKSYVLVRGNDAEELLRMEVKLGISNDKNVEIVSGITANDRIISKVKKYSLPKSTFKGSILIPQRPRSRSR